MPTKIITLGGGKQVPLSSYVAGIKTAKANPRATFSHGLTGWWPITGKEILDQFRDGIHDRINIRGKIIHPVCNMDRYTEKRRLAAHCAWCESPIPKPHFNPNVKHNFCSDDCNRAFNAW